MEASMAAIEVVELGGACEDCVMAIANDDYTGMSEAREAEVRDAVESKSRRGYLVIGERTGFNHNPCAICGGYAGERHEVWRHESWPTS
jgi:hypothetical protein